MSCEKLFWKDPYMTTLETCVTAVKDNMITLEKTIIYAFSGGQQSDSARINGFDVLQAIKVDREIYYDMGAGHPFRVGEIVRLELDWQKRYRLMRLHFAAEIVLEWVYQNYNHPTKIGANITEDKARVDFEWEGNISLIFERLMQAFVKIVADDLPIISDFDEGDAEQRYWEIEGFAKVPCGGTHIRRIGEIGKVKFKRSNPGQGKERIEIVLMD